jgi:hypothetical protein
MHMNLKFQCFEGKLDEIIEKIDLSTVQHACDIHHDRYVELQAIKLGLVRRSYDLLIDKNFITADFPIYTYENDNGEFDLYGKPILYLATRQHNLILKNMDEALAQMEKSNYFFPNNAAIDEIRKADSTLRVALSDLRHHQRWEDHRQRFDDAFEQKSKLNSVEQRLIERVVGYGDVFRTSKEIPDALRPKHVAIDFVSAYNVGCNLKYYNAKYLSTLCILGRGRDGNGIEFGIDYNPYNSLHINHYSMYPPNIRATQSSKYSVALEQSVRRFISEVAKHC